MLPYDPDAERAVLSCAMLDAGSHDKISSHPNAASLFYIPAHQIFWKGITALKNSGKELDLVTLNGWLRDNGQLERVGGSQAVAEMQEDVPTTALLGRWLTTLKDKATLRAVIASGEEFINRAYDNPDDVDQLLERMEADAIGLADGRKNIADSARRWDKIVESSLTEIQERYEAGGKIPGISTGYEALDEMTNGFQPEQMVVIAARPSQGKSALAMNLGANLCRAGVPVGVFSLEMAAEQLAVRTLSSDSGLDGLALGRGRLEGKRDFQKVFQAAAKQADWPLFMDDTSGVPLSHIRRVTRRLVKEHGVKLIIVDYLQLIEKDKDAWNKEDAVGRISNGLKRLARELKITVIPVAQLNRENDKGKGRAPKNSDLRDSGSIEQDADVILLLDPQFSGESEDFYDYLSIDVNLIVGKARGGSTGIVKLEFNKQTTTFKQR